MVYGIDELIRRKGGRKWYCQKSTLSHHAKGDVCTFTPISICTVRLEIWHKILCRNRDAFFIHTSFPQILHSNNSLFYTQFSSIIVHLAVSLLDHDSFSIREYCFTALSPIHIYTHVCVYIVKLTQFIEWRGSLVVRTSPWCVAGVSICGLHTSWFLIPHRKYHKIDKNEDIFENVCFWSHLRNINKVFELCSRWSLFVSFG